MGIIKGIYKIFNGESWDEHYLKTSSDQVVHTKSDGTATTVQSELLELNSKFVDYIIEQGTSDGWFYRKWYSGRLEAFRVAAFLFTDSPTVFGNGYYESSSVALPANLFTAAPEYGFCNVDIPGSASYYSWLSSATSIHIRVVSATAYAAGNQCSLTLHMIGRWK